ncbi:MAG: outer membrane beta-barrel protein [Flavobacteriales bacterium]|nr:outer membrane beta-barrel protein [Flavobacteriales bacterium]
MKTAINNRIAIPLCFIFIGAATVFAQEVKKMKFGMMASPTLNWMKSTTNGVDGVGSKVAFNYGLVTDFAISSTKPYYISTGLMVTTTGGIVQSAGAEIYNGSLVQTINKSDMTIRYIEIPFALKMQSSEIGYSRFTGSFGLGTGFKIAAHQTVETEYYTSTGRVNESKGKVDLSNGSQLMRLSMIIGFDWERQISGDTYLSFGLRFNNGLTNVLKGTAYVVDTNGETDLAENYGDGTPRGEDLKATSKSLSFVMGVYF